MSSTVTATLQRAQDNAGSRRALAALLDVPAVDLENWMLGKTHPPSYVFLRALDLAFSATSPVAPRRP